MASSSVPGDPPVPSGLVEPGHRPLAGEYCSWGRNKGSDQEKPSPSPMESWSGRCSLIPKAAKGKLVPRGTPLKAQPAAGERNVDQLQRELDALAVGVGLGQAEMKEVQS